MAWRRRAIPYIAQVEIADCGAAALAMALGYHGRHVSLPEVHAAVGTGRDGVDALALTQAAGFYGLRARGVATELDDLRVLPRGTILHWGASHFVVLDSTSRRGVTIVDPLAGRYRVGWPVADDLYSGVAPDELWTGTPSGTFGAFGYGAGAFNAGGPAEMTDAAMEKASEPRVIVTVTPDRFVVLPLPDNAKPYSLRLIYALKPKRSATGMDSVIMDELEDLLVHSALQDLLVMPSTNWGDRELAAYHAKQYLSRVTERRARANLGTARGTLRVKHLPFA